MKRSPQINFWAIFTIFMVIAFTALKSKMVEILTTPTTSGAPWDAPAPGTDDAPD